LETDNSTTQRIWDHPVGRRASHSIKVLYCVSSIGLGHARRSIAIAQKLRTLDKKTQFDFDWLAAEPARSFLVANGEKVLDVSSQLESLSAQIEFGAKNGKIRDMSEVARASARAAKKNYMLIKSIPGDFDVLVQDEFVETLFSFLWEKSPALPKKKAIITDYIKLESRSLNPINAFGTAYANRVLKKAYMNQQLRIYAEDQETLPRSGRIRNWVLKNFEIVGPVVENLPTESKGQLKKKLLRSTEDVRFIVVTIGGTSIGKKLAHVIMRDANRISEKLGAYLVLLLGPRVDPKSLGQTNSSRISLVPFTNEALGFFKAADCVVAQAGASTLNELASIGVPCVVVPVENHFEQQRNAKRFSEKYGFKILKFGEITGPSLVQAIEEAEDTEYQPMPPTKAALRAAGLIYDLAIMAGPYH
jgi:predicted glycosyltransferase